MFKIAYTIPQIIGRCRHNSDLIASQ